MSITAGGSRPHVLVFPYPAQGHSLVLLDLTHQLSLRNIAITILVTPKNLPALHPLLTVHPTIETLVLPLPPHPKLPPGLENIREIGVCGNIAMVNALSKLHDPIVEWFNSHTNPPVAIISDFFLGWTQKLADQIKIPRICFFSNRVAIASLFDYCWRNIKTVRSLPVVEFHELPKSPSFKQEHMPSIIRLFDESDPDSRMVRHGFIANGSSWGLVFNSFDFLEGEFLDHLRMRTGHHRSFGVGPLNLFTLPQSLERGIPDNNFHGCGGDVLSWLEGCADGSVLYLLVDEMGVALKVCEGDDGVPDSAELGKVIDESMCNVDNSHRVKVREMRDQAFEAVSDTGSSCRDLDQLVKELRLLLN
ncbi:hypothetical protein FEM48_Zijuj10G0105400 [Ziziphus jujuba var. spinosa]|uniref:UDP-glycosyltransferase 89A2-like n=1 Tax=Ziziphus jujuba var. spinosa TaxID=714518 RepID=A0A978UMV5_ZIZJJ|nr:hypothetical protein FEM48_Zijuj10G0105400 [Ziziphus jujuba var. spinosa]